MPKREKLIVISVLLALAVVFLTGILIYPALQENNLSVTGTVKFNDLEGGFWGITADDNKNYDPVNLPIELQKDGLRAEFKLKIAENQAGTHMWGTIVEVVGYKIIGQESGIIGIVLLGPTCPVVREGLDCDDKPYETDIVIKNKSANKIIVTIRSGKDGKFKVVLPAGEYWAIPQPEKKTGWPIPGSPQLVRVETGKFSEIEIHYDTGIR